MQDNSIDKHLMMGGVIVSNYIDLYERKISSHV